MKIRLLTAAIAVGLFATASHANTILTATGPFTPSFRGDADTTYFGWSIGTWDGNPPANPGDPDITPDVINGTPSINPESLAGPLLVQNTSTDVVSSSNNIYTGPSAVNLTLTIPTDGAAGSGFTTIIAQGNGLGGFGGMMDVFSFGAIDGVTPTFIYGANAEGETQFWAKWEIPGNAPSYSVSVGGTNQGAGVLSMSDLTIDALWSPNGYASDTAAAVPEPTSFALVGAALACATVLVRRRR